MTITLAVTTNIGCNNMCSYCPQTKFLKAYKKRSSIRQLNRDTFQRCIEKLPNGSYINFAGFSEPCLNSNYVELVLIASRLGFKIRILTTTIGMTLPDIDIMEDIPFARFSVHLPDDRQQTRIEVNEKYIQVINRLIRSRINVEWKYHHSPLMNEGLHPKLKSIFINENIYGAVKKAGLITRANNIEIRGQRPVGKIYGKISGCHLLHTNQLLPNGDVFICCMDWNLKYLLGNLLQNSYEKIFQGKAYKEFIEGLFNDESDILCRYCELCKGA